MSLTRLQVSAIVCTHNPRRDLLGWTLASLGRQTMPRANYEIVVVDSGSTPCLEQAEVPGARLVRADQSGLARARVAGIGASSAPLIVFADDDNYLDPNYLEQAASIASANPDIGCFGGRSDAILEKPLPGWKSRLLAYLGVRDYGPLRISSTDRQWGEWEPIGAGLVARRAAAELYSHWVTALPDAARLGREGRALMSGDDSLIAQAAYVLGFACSYEPSLRLVHWMKPGRFKLKTIARTLEGHGRSHVVLQALKGEPVNPMPLPLMSAWLAWQFFRRVRRCGWSLGSLEWFLDLGYSLEARR